MIFTGPTASARISYHLDCFAERLPQENATRVTVALSLLAPAPVYATLSYRATVGTVTQSASREITLTGEPTPFCRMPNILIFHDEAGRADATVSVTATFGGERVDFSCKLPLESIDRTSRLTALSGAVAGERLFFTLLRYSQAFTHRVTLCVGTYEKTQEVGAFDVSSEVEGLIALPLEAIARVSPSAAYCDGSLTLTTYWGEEVVGTDTRALRVEIPACEETCPTLTATLTPVAPDGFAGVYLQGKTPIALTLTGEAKYGAAIAYCEAILEGERYVAATQLHAPRTSGEVPITLRVVDTRGHACEEIRTVSVQPYAAPRLLPPEGYPRPSAWRGEGTELMLALGAAISPVKVAGEEKNGYTLQYRLRAMSETAFGEWITLAVGAPFVGVAVGVSLSRAQSYAVELSCIDLVGERSTLTQYVSTEEVSFHLRAGGMGAAFGKYAEEERVLEIAPDWTLRLHGNLDDSVTLTDTAAYASGEDSPYCRVRLVGGKRVRAELALPFEGNAPQTLAADFLDARALPQRKVLALCPCTDGAVACVSLDTSGTLSLLSVHGEGDTSVHTLCASLEYDAR